MPVDREKTLQIVSELKSVLENPDIKKIGDELDISNFHKSASYLMKVSREMQEIAMSVRMIPLDGLFKKIHRLVRDLSKRFSKPINLEIIGAETEMDRNIIEEISDPLVHILRNSLIPVVTYLSIDFGILLVGATVTEGIFNVPGVGRTLYQAIIRGEGPTVVSFVTVMVLIYLVVNLLTDLLYAVLDPRVRYGK